MIAVADIIWHLDRWREAQVAVGTSERTLDSLQLKIVLDASLGRILLPRNEDHYRSIYWPLFTEKGNPS